MIGILAFGSLIPDPGNEIATVTVDCIDTETPFKVEFGRSSRSRSEAPTLVPVKVGGAKVKAAVFVLVPSVTKSEAADMLWRRETRCIGTGRRYNPPASPQSNNVLVKSLTGFAGLDTVLYTDFPESGKLDNPTPQRLAELAIESAKAEAGAKCMDGISYLIAAKEACILTPLMPEYEKEIIDRAGATDLKDALDRIRVGLLKTA